ncbi:hypothetical protein ACIBK8_30990 [Streptomyces sp. NPDC050161]|uniref:hypothetical protein n=1 Tax=Streptomyces sp. NPDC050161 TaxID=3365604 RepID=UPI0037A95FD4
MTVNLHNDGGDKLPGSPYPGPHQILGGPALIAANTEIRLAKKKGGDEPCDPACDPNAECSPGFPSSECDPRR